MKRYLYPIIFCFILLVGFFLRFYHLGSIPNGFYQDESAIGYNAYSIMLTGKDEHGVAYPLYFKSFGDYKLPIYIYATIPAIKLFGMTEFAVRFPSALFGFLTIIAAFFFVKEITKNDILALITAGLIAINPWSLDYNRATFEVSISLFLYLLGGLCMYRGINKKIPLLFLLGTLCFVLDVYTYNLTRLLSPLLYLLILFTGFKRNAVSKKEIIATIIISGIVLLPFAKTFFAQGGLASAKGTLIFSSAAVKAPLLEMRSYFVHSPAIVSHILFSMPVQYVWQYILNIISYLSVSFFFVSGSTHGNHGIGNVGEFYIFELPLFIVGIIAAVKRKYSWKTLLFGWIIIPIMVASLTRDIPQATRSFFIIFPVELFVALGLIQTWNLIAKIKQRVVKLTFIVVGLSVMTYAIFFYFASYYVRFPILYAPDWRQQDKAVSLYLLQNQNKYKKIIIDNDSGFIYTSLLFDQKYSPSEFQQTAVWTPDDSEGMSRPVAFGKYEIREIDWQHDYAQPNTLIITTLSKKPASIPIIATFLYPTRPVVIANKQDIFSYPVTDVAYVAVKTKQ